MKIETILIDVSVFPEGPRRTGTLTAEHAPELLPDGWVRFTAYGQVHLIPPGAVRRVTYAAAEPVVAIKENEPSISTAPVTLPGQAKRGRPSKQ